MKRLVGWLLLPAWGAAMLAGCGGASGDALPSGTFAGSTATDRALVVEIGSTIKVDRREARLIDRGMIEVRDGSVRTTLTCRKTDPKGQELRCTVRHEPPRGPATSEVVDLMLL